MKARHSVRIAALLLSGAVASFNLPAQQPPQPPAGATQPQAPAPPMPPRGRMPGPGPRFGRGEMPKHGPGRDFDRPGMGGGEFRIGPMGMWWKNQALVQRIGLTADQTKKMDDIFQQSRLQLIDLKANLEKQNLLLEPMLSANPVDQAKTLAQIDKVAQARADLEKANAKMLLGIRGVLTPDQWTKLHSGGRDASAPGPAPAAAGPGAAGAPGQRGAGRGGRGMAGGAPGGGAPGPQI